MKYVTRRLRYALIEARLLISSHRLEKAIKRLESAQYEAEYHKREVDQLTKDLSLWVEAP